MRLKRLHEPERSHFARILLRNRIFSKGGAETIGAALRIACPPMLSLLSFEWTVCHDDRRCPAHRHTRLTHNALLFYTMNRIPITAAGAAKLKAELDYLKKTARPNVVAAIAEAREKAIFRKTPSTMPLVKSKATLKAVSLSSKARFRRCR